MTDDSPATTEPMINAHLMEMSPRDGEDTRATADLVLLPHMLGFPEQPEQASAEPGGSDWRPASAQQRGQVPLVPEVLEEQQEPAPQEEHAIPGMVSAELGGERGGGGELEEEEERERGEHVGNKARKEAAGVEGSFESALFDVATGEERSALGEAGEEAGEEKGVGGAELAAAEAYRLRQRIRLYKIQELKQRLEGTQVQRYAEEMAEEALEGEAITVGSVSAEALQEQHKAVQREREREAKEASRLHRRRQDILARQEEEAAREVRREAEELEAKGRGQAEERVARDSSRARSVRKAFRAAQATLVHSLRERGAALRERFGVLGVDAGGRAHLLAQQRQWKLSAALATAPHPVKVRIDTVRVLRDKVQRGHCVVVATLLDRLGGNPLSFPGAGQHYRSRTRPTPHQGRYMDLDLLVSEHLFLLCPPDAKLLGSMCVLFELYQCKSRLHPVDRAVGWGVFPLVSCAFQLASGKFKAPLLRGAYDPEVKLYEELEQRMRKDLDTWLGNLYFKISGMSRYVHEEREYALRMDYTSELLGIANPKRLDLSSLDDIKVDAQQPLPASPAPDPADAGPEGAREEAGRESGRAAEEGGDRKSVV